MIDLRRCRKRVVAVFEDGATADVTAACTGLARDDNSGELAQRLTVEADGTVPVENRGPLYRVLVPWVRLILSASTDDGATWTETFRGAITDWQYGSDDALTLTAYDDLIFLTRSDGAFTFPEGQSGADVLRAILGSAVLPAAIGQIDGPTVAMPKLALSGKLSEMVMQVLQHALAIGDKAYWVRMREGKLEVVVPGGNGPRYALGEVDSVSTWLERRVTDDVASEVQVLGATREGDDQQRPVLATAAADGGLQASNARIVAQLDGQQYDTPATAQAAADLELERRRMPAVTRTATTLGVPWLRRGDLVRLRAGTADGLVQAAGIAWDEDDDTMVLTVAEQGTPLYQAKKIEDAVLGGRGATGGCAALGTLFAYCRSGLGGAYVYGHKSFRDWDCSGYTKLAFASIGVDIGGGTSEQEAGTRGVKVASPKPGDLVFFPGHVGIVSEDVTKMYNANLPETGTILSRIGPINGGGPDYRRPVDFEALCAEERTHGINQPATGGIEGFILDTAGSLGFSDPRVAVRVAELEGGLADWAAPGDFNTNGAASSFGPYQLHYGGLGSPNGARGLGDAFTAATGLDARDPRNGAAATRYALQQALAEGWTSWHAAAAAGIGRWQGIR